VGEYPAAFNQEVLNSGDLEVIDAKNKYILPGLIDAHCHVGMWEDSVGFEGMTAMKQQILLLLILGL